ncbi:penicillin-binding protein 1A [Salinisphaera orenii]|uniref:penicillin-binding protein 1A n=1 Tax=Salinisphaera orenii TaxID=856731 RepID=UPI000DBEA550
MWTSIYRTLIWIAASLLSLSLVTCLIAGGIYWHFARHLPHPKPGIAVKLHEPLRIYTADHKLIGVYGKQKRIPIQYADIPKQVINAFVAAEDDRFFEHPGVDYQGIVRAAVHLLATGRKTQGGSTITMQLARDLYLSDKRTFTRKIKETILALRLNDTFSKQEIFQLYVNKIYLGKGAYGVAAAAQTYYHKPLAQLDIAEIAMIAGLPKAPSAFNPINNPSRAKTRRNYVLARMHDLGQISDKAYQQAKQAVITAQQPPTAKQNDRFKAPYIAAMVRKKMIARYGAQKAYTAGFDVVTTITSARQKAARKAIHNNLRAYAKRHAWNGASRSVSAQVAKTKAQRQQKLAELQPVAGTRPAIVTGLNGDTISVAIRNAKRIKLGPQDNPWLSSNHDASKMVDIGDIVYLHHTDSSAEANDTDWRLTEHPEVEGALVSLDPHNGAIQALVGGYDYDQSKFNRATQAHRQTGSSFKPFLYSAALANGFTAATIVNDAPIVYQDASLDESWRPQNYSGKYFGPTRLRTGLVHSRNLVSIRVLRRIGINPAVNHISQFGLGEKQLPHSLSLALGSASFSPLQMARGYAVFANNGFLISPHLIKTIKRGQGETVYRANPERACSDRIACPGQQQPSSSTRNLQYAPRAIPADNAYIVGDMMRDVIKNGTGRGALKLHREDLSGKTGTTNKQIDAWFGGFNANLVTVCWVGFDQLKSLGHYETGAHAALPIWTDFMGAALADASTTLPSRPDDIADVKINPDTGQRALHSNGINEIFRKQNVPTKAEAKRSGQRSPSEDVQSLF